MHHRRNLHESPESSSKRQGKILLMDDDRYFSLITAEMIRDMGYSVAIAKNVSEAVSIYRVQMEKGDPFDAVILDIHVRNSAGAGETLVKLLEIDRAIKAVVSSRSHSDPLMEHYEHFGFKSSLPKPYSPAEVWNAISRAINST
jgi:two-component system cell cycle sensor histidine kinase/response regulator CckA